MIRTFQFDDPRVRHAEPGYFYIPLEDLICDEIQYQLPKNGDEVSTFLMCLRLDAQTARELIQALERGVEQLRED